MSLSKSLTKRVRFTKNGKMVRRAMATDHFRTRSTQKNIRNKRQSRGLNYPIKKFLTY